MLTDSAVNPLPYWDSEATWRTFEDGTFNQQIEGIELQKSQDDLDRYAALIDETQPDIIVECGTRTGGSALWFAEQGLQVVSIDINPGPRVKDRVGIQWITGNTVADAVFQQVLPLLTGKRVMVSLDSDHHALHVIREIGLWAPEVTSGCALVVEDGCFELWSPERAKRGGTHIPQEGGPLKAINKQLGLLADLGFWRDTFVENMTPISHSPGGWWRRRD